HRIVRPKPQRYNDAPSGLRGSNGPSKLELSVVEPARSRITIESSAGALIELRFMGSPTFEDTMRFRADTASLVRRTVEREKRRAIICTDLRGCGLLKPEVSEVIIGLMR